MPDATSFFPTRFELPMRWPTLRHKRQFDLVYSQGRKRTSPALVLFHLGTAPDPGVAFVASRRVGGAVARNRAKRLMRAAFREVASTRQDTRGWWVLVARKDIVRWRSPEVANELRRMIEGLDHEADRPGVSEHPSSDMEPRGR